MIKNLKIKSPHEDYRLAYFHPNYVYSFTYELPELFETKKFTGNIQSQIELKEKDIIKYIYEKHEFDNKPKTVL